MDSNDQLTSTQPETSELFKLTFLTSSKRFFDCLDNHWKNSTQNMFENEDYRNICSINS